MILLFCYILIIFLINQFVIKKKIILSNTGSVHQSFANSSVPLTGGTFILLPIMYLLIPNNLFFLGVFFLLFLLGIFSDLNIFSSAKKRFFLQLILIMFFVINQKTQVLPIRIDFIDNFIEDTYWSYFLTIFCLLILINGSNFIDGLNGLLLGYISLILIILYQIGLIQTLNFSIEKLNFLILIILFLFLMNIFNQLFLGDGGAYPLGFFIGFMLIKIYNFNQNISPYFIVLLLWYPCFEILFSIIRKIILKKNPLDPDTGHLHQNLFFFIKNKLKLDNLKSNIFSSLVILVFNSCVFYFASKSITHTASQIYLLLFCVTIYLVLHFMLRRN